MQKGKFITIDGVEGAGKSTQIDFIDNYFRDKNINLILTREPGGTELGEKIRHLLLNTETKSMHLDTELLLMFASRNEHIQQKIIPNLAHGNWVLSDRFTDASYAYQGGGRGQNAERINALEHWVLGDFTPDMTLLLDIDPALGLMRKKGKKDRIEQEQLDFFNRARKIYLNRAKQFPKRIKLIDATQTPKHTSAQIKQVLNEL